jgi:hypothetical protein
MTRCPSLHAPSNTAIAVFFLKKTEEVILCFALFYPVSLSEPCYSLANLFFWPGNGWEPLKFAHEEESKERNR